MKKLITQTVPYDSDLSEKQWAVIAPLFGLYGNKAKYDHRYLVNAVLYWVKTGCQWRMLPKDFPPYSTVHTFYRRARIAGTWDKVLEAVVKKTRVDAGRNPEPTLGIIDSQSVKTCYASENRGIDGGKKRKAENDI
jgi:putative transposase